MKILVPIDGSKSSKLSLKVAKKMGLKFEADLMFLTVVPDVEFLEQYPTNYTYSIEIENANHQRAEFVLEKVLEDFNDYPYKHETFYANGNPASRIIEFATEHKVDLIIMGNRGLGAFSRTLLGSVSNKVINHSEISVLVVKGEMEEE